MMRSLMIFIWFVFCTGVAFYAGELYNIQTYKPAIIWVNTDQGNEPLKRREEDKIANILHGRAAIFNSNIVYHQGKLIVANDKDHNLTISGFSHQEGFRR